jgi:hypothetical protein
MLKRNSLFALTALAALAAAPASAISIGAASFGATRIVESFEGLAAGPNINIGLGSSLLQPGTVSAFAFASGVVLSSPVPNPGVFNAGAFVHNFAIAADVTNNWGSNGTVASAANVPFGLAYLGAFASSGTASFTLSFATPQDRVGAYVTGVNGTSVTMRVYDAAGTLLETVNAATVPVGSWGTNFIGIQRPDQISRVVFSAPDFGIDGFTFENDLVLVPEPSTLTTFALGLFGIWGLAVLGRGPRARVAVPVRVPAAQS